MKKTERNYAADEVIFREGDPSDTAFVLVSGRVELYKDVENSQVMLEGPSPGEIFGETEALDGSPRNATARAVKDSVVEVIDRKAFSKANRGESEIAMNATRRMASRLPGTGDMPVADQARSEADAAGKTQGLIDRFLSTFRRTKIAKLEIRVAEFGKDEGGAEIRADGMKRLMAAFEKRKGIDARPLDFPICMEHKGARDTELAAATAAAHRGLRASGADLVVWADVPPPGATLHLRFVSHYSDLAERTGSFPPSTALTLPLDFNPDLGDILVAVALAATKPDDEKNDLLDALLANAGEKAAAAMATLPDDLTSKEKGALHLCFANMAETIAQRLSRNELHSLAAKHYKEALKVLREKDSPLAWALAHKHLGSLLLATGERSRQGQNLFEQAADASRNAMKVFTQTDFPMLWADLQNRLGQSLYRLEEKEGDVEMLKHALGAYQSALRVYSKINHADDRWADVMHNLARAAQILGGQLRSREALEKSIEACESALTVRDRATDPMQWAGIQNTLGSALFLLAKQTKSFSPLAEAATAFEAALSVYTEKGAKRLEKIAEKNLTRARKLMERKRNKNLPNDSRESSE